jgi:hypothetical protein
MQMKSLLAVLVFVACATAARGTLAQAAEVNVKLGPKDARPAMRWLLTVSGTGLAKPQTFLVAEYDSGEVPMPTASPWRCHWEAVDAFRDRQMVPDVDPKNQPTGLYKKVDDVRVFRSLNCSADGYKTGSSNSGAYMFSNGLLQGEPSAAEMHIFAKASDATRLNFNVELRPCPLAGAQPMFCPTQLAALAGSIAH